MQARIVPIFFLCFVVSNLAEICIDGEHNAVTVENINEDLDIHLVDVKLATYDKDDKPACKDGKPQMRFPGIVKLLNGSIRVKAANNLLSERLSALFTIRKDSVVIGTVCERGKSKIFFIPNRKCVANVTQHLGPVILKTLEQPGTYDILELASRTGFHTVVNVESPGRIVNAIISGGWKAEIKVLSGKRKTIANVKVPANIEYVDVD